jgi:hypothetical protein
VHHECDQDADAGEHPRVAPEPPRHDAPAGSARTSTWPTSISSSPAVEASSLRRR